MHNRYGAGHSKWNNNKSIEWERNCWNAQTNHPNWHSVRAHDFDLHTDNHLEGYSSENDGLATCCQKLLLVFFLSALVRRRYEDTRATSSRMPEHRNCKKKSLVIYFLCIFILVSTNASSRMRVRHSAVPWWAFNGTMGSLIIEEHWRRALTTTAPYLAWYTRE